MLWSLSPLGKLTNINYPFFCSYVQLPVIFENTQITPIKTLFDITSPLHLSLSVSFFLCLSVSLSPTPPPPPTPTPNPPLHNHSYPGVYLRSTLIYSLANSSLVSTSILSPNQLLLGLPMISVSLSTHFVLFLNEILCSMGYILSNPWHFFSLDQYVKNAASCPVKYRLCFSSLNL